MNLELSDDEALVLFDLLEEYNHGRMLVIRHAAERNVLWSLTCLLERQLVAPFERDYNEQLEAARARIEEHGGGW